MTALRLVLGDQLDREVSSLRDIDPRRDIVLMAEVHEEMSHVPHHPQKIALVLSAMRHFAERLRGEGLRVDYVELEGPDNSGSLTSELARALSRHEVDRVVVTEPGEWRVWEAVQSWSGELGLPVEIRDDDRFLCSRAGFARWMDGRKQPRMEHFYRRMRRATGWLMDDGRPLGGTWNYDSANREPLPDEVVAPDRTRFDPDRITRDVMAMVGRRYRDHFGDLQPFGWAVTREGALGALGSFVERCLPRFGDYQDAMRAGDDLLFHSVLSPYLNIGLLRPREVCEAAIGAMEADGAPINAVEGFVRQILGWREYVRGIYWTTMPEYAATNFLAADRPLPSFYWTGATDMRCVRECLQATRRNAYAHHIQRLMVTGNFALLAGIAPAEVERWYLSVYADAFEWVELPNTHGMALHADGGLLGSKPYAASGAYIDRMSDYCGGCAFDPKVKLGAGVCPFNVLYWAFLIRNRERLSSNPRMGLQYRTLDRMDERRRQGIIEQAEEILAAVE